MSGPLRALVPYLALWPDPAAPPRLQPRGLLSMPGLLSSEVCTCCHVSGLPLIPAHKLQILSVRSGSNITFLVKSFRNHFIDLVAFSPLLSCPFAHVSTTECPCINWLGMSLHLLSAGSLRIRIIFAIVSPAPNQLSSYCKVPSHNVVC